VALGPRADRSDEFLGHGWTLVSRHALPEGLLTPRQRRLLDMLDVRIAHVTPGAVPDAYVDIDGEYDLWFRRTGRKAFLQRPDGYVFGAVSTVEELPALLDSLAERLSATGWSGVPDLRARA
jgi:hypothetical protein